MGRSVDSAKSQVVDRACRAIDWLAMRSAGYSPRVIDWRTVSMVTPAGECPARFQRARLQFSRFPDGFSWAARRG